MGGKNSGHYGHAGRPGHVGGSMPTRTNAGQKLRKADFQRRLQVKYNQAARLTWTNPSQENLDKAHKLANRMGKVALMDLKRAKGKGWVWMSRPKNKDLDAYSLTIAARTSTVGPLGPSAPANIKRRLERLKIASDKLHRKAIDYFAQAAEATDPGIRDKYQSLATLLIKQSDRVMNRLRKTRAKYGV